MENIDKEFWKQLAGSMVRKLLVVIATALAGHGWITSEQSEGVSSLAVVEFIVAAICYIAPLIWAWAKINFNVQAIREARTAEPDTPIGVITTNTLAKKSVISSV